MAAQFFFAVATHAAPAYLAARVPPRARHDGEAFPVTLRGVANMDRGE
ncbi:MAG: hypothetical protein ABW039_04400 [Sphingobium sp.]